MHYCHELHNHIHVFPSFQQDSECSKILSAQAWRWRAIETDRWHSRMNDVNPRGAASHGLSRATAHVSTTVSVRSEINGLEITKESLSRGHWMLHAYGQIGSQLLSEAPPTSYWHAYYWLHLHMGWLYDRDREIDGRWMLVILWGSSSPTSGNVWSQ